jgi:hypothetical protein
VDRDPPARRPALHVEQGVQPADVHEGRGREVDRQAGAGGFARQALVEEGDQHRRREPVELPGHVQHHPAAVQPVQMQAESLGHPLQAPVDVAPVVRSGTTFCDTPGRPA